MSFGKLKEGRLLRYIFTIFGLAMINENDGKISDILQGSVIDKLDSSQAAAEDVCII